MYRRFKRLFRSRRKSTYDPYPDTYNDERTSPTPNSPSSPIPNQNRQGINDSDNENVRNNTQVPFTTLPRQTRPITPFEESRPLTPTPPVNPRSTPNPSRQNGLPNNNNNNNINPPNNNNDNNSVSNHSIRGGLPTQPPSSDPPNDSNPQPPPPPPLLPPINPRPQSSLRDRFPTLADRNRYPLRMSPNTTLLGFPQNQNRTPSFPARSFFTPQQNQSSYPTRLYPSQVQTQLPNIQVDYPIENVLIDENISPSIAFKINDAVEYDRFGNIYHKQHYAYEPKTQNIAMGNNQQIERRFIGNSNQSGMRFIREITNENYYPNQQQQQRQSVNNIQLIQPQQQSTNDIQFIIDNTPQINYTCEYKLDSFPAPINHFIAYASPNDPMRYY